MQKACRIIIEDILNGKISTRRDLEVEKRQLCRDLNLSKFMSNADILEFAKPEEMEIVSSLITEDGIKVEEIKDALEYMKSHYRVLSIKNLVTSINRFRKETPKEETPVPDFVKDFLSNIK